MSFSDTPGAGHGHKGEGVAGTGAARVAAGRRGSAPSPRANAPRQSLAYARAGAVFRARARGRGETPGAQAPSHAGICQTGAVGEEKP